jgi:hypothetical protein
MAAFGGHVEVIQKLWCLAKKLQLTPEELRNEVLLSKGKFEETPWHMAAFGDHIEVIQKLWDLLKKCS